MIQRQDIVPPWIEKQQELVKAASVFRARLRNDWTRHAARSIASRGGSLQEQMRRAEMYAASERVHNPKRRAVEQIAVPTSATNDPVMVKITQDTTPSTPSTPSTPAPPPSIEVSVETKDSELKIAESAEEKLPLTESSIPQSDTPAALPPPFRLPEWEQAELSYLTLAITNLNNITRSYNLMAPNLAKKPYFSLERELKSCYADVAPILAREIKDRATRPVRQLVEEVNHKPGGVLERFAKDTAKIYDSKRPLYGFKEFWNDLFGEKRP
jgi:hypothetical protein